VAGPTHEVEGRNLVIGPGARALKRQLGPTAWAVLEDVALDARFDDGGRLVATTSSRRVAENLGLTSGTVSRALGRLRSLDLVEYARQSGTGGRFGVSAYVLGALPGIEVLAADRDRPPRLAQPCAAHPRSAQPRAAGPCAGDANTAEPAQRRRAPRSQQDGGQLDLLSLEPDVEPTVAQRQGRRLDRSES